MAAAKRNDVGFTPGLWGDGSEALCVKIDRERPWASTVFRRDYDGSEANALVAMSFGATVEEATANARLIAAAPKMYAALEAMVSTQDSGSFEEIGLATDAALAALAKARGDA